MQKEHNELCNRSWTQQIKKQKNENNLHVMNLNNTCEIILGQPFLQSGNPIIDWKKRTLTFKSYACGEGDWTSSQFNGQPGACHTLFTCEQTIYTYSKHQILDEIDTYTNSVVAESQP